MPRSAPKWFSRVAAAPARVEQSYKQLVTLAERSDRRVQELQEQVRRLERRIDALTRVQRLDTAALPAPYDLTAHRFRAYSQNDEDGLALEIVRRAGTGPGLFVDIGCGVKGGNGRFFAEELGWSGLMIDARPEISKLEGRFPPGRVRALSTWVTRENVDDLLRDNGLSGEIDMLSIDVDGIDYWLWDAVSAVSPRLVVCEYNSYFGPDAAVTVPYRREFNRKESDTRYYGASLAALDILGRRKGYRLVAVEPTGVNAFFLRDDVGPDIPGFAPAQVFRRQPRHQAAIEKGHFDMTRFVPENDMGLVDVAGSNGGQVFWQPARTAS